MGGACWGAGCCWKRDLYFPNMAYRTLRVLFRSLYTISIAETVKCSKPHPLSLTLRFYSFLRQSNISQQREGQRHIIQLQNMSTREIWEQGHLMIGKTHCSSWNSGAQYCLLSNRPVGLELAALDYNIRIPISLK